MPSLFGRHTSLNNNQKKPNSLLSQRMQTQSPGFLSSSATLTQAQLRSSSHLVCGLSWLMFNLHRLRLSSHHSLHYTN